jgi:hypothetical protein
MEWTRLLSEFEYRFHSAKCLHCNKASIWTQNAIELTDSPSTIAGLHVPNFDGGELIYPNLEINILASPDMPDDVKQDFNEAKAVFYKSPRAAAALLRLALQKLCKHLGQPGENINADIGALVKNETLNSRIQKVADTIRIVGNNAVHPGQMLDEDIERISEKMFTFINMIVHSAITEPREIEETFGETPKGARDAIERRDDR